MFPNEFVFLSLPKSDLIELHRAYLARWLMQERLRHEQGLEEINIPPILEHLERLIGMTEDQAHQLFHQTEDELWENAWYAFTDEWAWHRARQDATKDRGPRTKSMRNDDLDALAEKYYEKNFEKYVKEIDMDEDKISVKQKKRTKH